MLSKEETEKADFIARIISDYELRRHRIKNVESYKEYQELHEQLLVKIYDKYVSNQDKWISVKGLPDAKEVGKKVLLFREMNEGQREMEITVYDTFLVKHCDPETTFWQPLPKPPKQ